MTAEANTIQVDENEHAELTDNVMTFAVERGLVAYVKQAMDTAREVFTGAQRVSASRKRDEYGASYIDINVVIRDEPDVEAEKYSACVERWARFIPPAAGDNIHLSTSWAK